MHDPENDYRDHPGRPDHRVIHFPADPEEKA